MEFNYEYKQEWINEIRVNEWSVITYAKQFENSPSKAFRKLESLLLLKALTFVDLATLFGDDTTSNVSAVINKACKHNFHSFTASKCYCFSLFIWVLASFYN